MFNQFVKVQVVFQCVLILKVRSHGEHDVTSGVVIILIFHCRHKFSHSLIYIVTFQLGVILRGNFEF